MSKKLYISDDSPVELKETIATAQRMMDNMAEFKVKADDGTLTFADLDELARRNNAISSEFPTAKEPVPGYPIQTKNMADLEALSKARLKEAEEELKKQGGPVFKINSLDQLEKLSKESPEALAKMVIDAATEKREANEPNKPSVKVGKVSVPGRSFHSKIFIEHLAKIQTLLYNAKTVFHNLSYDWEHAEIFEAQLIKHAKSFEDFGERAIFFLIGVLNGEDSGGGEELKQEAAFVLASIDTGDQDALGELIDTWKNDETVKEQVIQALKYGDNQKIHRRLESLLLEEAPEVQADFIDILAYRRKINRPLWKELGTFKEPIVEESMTRASIEAELPVKENTFDLILADNEASFYEDALFSGILNGDHKILIKSRKEFHERMDNLVSLPLYFACGCRWEDYFLLERCLDQEKPKEAAVKALGLLGMGESIPILIRHFSNTIASKKDWDEQKSIAESLELITGAGLDLPVPDIQEGPEGKEYEIKVVTKWNEIWTKWWMKNRNEYDEKTRYRRGKVFHLGSCLEEMGYPRGNYWSRQFSYYELQIRSGMHIAPFRADWYVAEQKEAIGKWKDWWTENQSKYETNQWLFAGKPH